MCLIISSSHRCVVSRCVDFRHNGLFIFMVTVFRTHTFMFFFLSFFGLFNSAESETKQNYDRKPSRGIYLPTILDSNTQTGILLDVGNTKLYSRSKHSLVRNLSKPYLHSIQLLGALFRRVNYINNIYVIE